MEGEAGENRELVRRVESFDVRRRVFFRIAELLRIFQDFLIPQPLASHTGKDIVGRAVDDARQRGDDVRLHPVDEGADNGNASDAACLVIQPRVGALCRRFQLIPMFAEEFFVGSDDRFSAVQRGKDEGFCRLYAADDFDHNIDIRVADDFGDIVIDPALLDTEVKRTLAVDFQNTFYIQVNPLRLAVKFPMIAQDLISSAPHDAQAEDRYADSFHFLPSEQFKSYKYFSPCKVSSLSTWSMHPTSLAMMPLNPPVATTCISGSFISLFVFLTI